MTEPATTPERLRNMVHDEYVVHGRFKGWAFDWALSEHEPEVGIVVGESFRTSQAVDDLTRKVDLLIKLCAGTGIVALAALINVSSPSLSLPLEMLGL